MNSLGGGHTHKHTHTDICTESILRNQARAWLLNFLSQEMMEHMTRYEKTVLMCMQNLTTFLTLNFNIFLSKHNVSMKLLLIVQLTMRNTLQFTEFVWLTQKVR